MTRENTPAPHGEAGTAKGPGWHPGRLSRALPLVTLAAGAALFFALGLQDYLSFDALRDHRESLLNAVETRPVLTALVFLVAYALAVVFLPPSGTVMTLAGGFVFGGILGAALVVVGATLGATVLFLACRHSLGDLFRDKAGKAVKRMEQGFRENALSYMLVLRLVPIFPFWLVNIAPAFLGVPLGVYVIGTFFGIIPGTVVYTIFGAGLGSILDRNDDLTLAGVVTPEILAGLIGLALLALIPVIYKKLKRSKPSADDPAGPEASS
ncbi:MAG: TVP38/TMEM64 family protein [Rhodospirillales bacterium]